MKLKFLVSIAGADVCFAPGDVAVIEPQTAAAWIASGIAEPATEEPAPEPISNDGQTSAHQTTSRKNKAHKAGR